MSVNFIVSNSYYVKYFIPMVAAIDDECVFYLMKSPRASCPYKNKAEIQALGKKYGFGIMDASSIKNSKGLTFMIEGAGHKEVPKSNYKVCLTALTDFQNHYLTYINAVDKVIFPSKYFAEYYSTISDKNLYLGSPKYDIIFDYDEIIKKYGLKGERFILVVYPRERDVNKIDLNRLYGYLKEVGYTTILKARGKEPSIQNLRPKYYFEDVSWYPHTTMELIAISDVVINFGSTVIKECVMMNTPIVNYDIKPFALPMEFLYNYSYCNNLKPIADKDKFKNSIDKLTSEDLSGEFKRARDNHLFESGNVAKTIMETVG